MFNTMYAFTWDLLIVLRKDYNIMNDITDEAKEIKKKTIESWNARFREYLKKNDYTQDAFRKAFNKRYGTNITQKDVSRWCNVGSFRGDKGTEIGFPSFTHMKLIANFFGVDVGHLVGDIDFKSYEQKDVCNYLGLSQNAINKLELALDSNTSYKISKLPQKESQDMLNLLLSASKFYELLYTLYDINNTLDSRGFESDLWDHLEDELGQQMLNKALEYIDEYNDINGIKLPTELQNAIFRARDTMDKCFEIRNKKEYDLDVYKYRLQHQVYMLIDELFPLS